jgi:hypothetical protein
MTEIIKFPSRKSLAAKEGRAESSPVHWMGTRVGGYARRNSRNPLRNLLKVTETAIVELNKVDYRHTASEIVREGVTAARVLADALEPARGLDALRRMTRSPSWSERPCEKWLRNLLISPKN